MPEPHSAGRPSPLGEPRRRSLSVVVPVLNEERGLDAADRPPAAGAGEPRPRLGGRFRRRRLHGRHARHAQGHPRPGPPPQSDLAQPQLRQGDRHSGRPEVCEGRCGRADGRGPAASARADTRFRRALARGLRHRLRPAPRSSYRQLPPPLGRARLLCGVPEAERHDAARRRRRLPPARPQGGRCHEPHERACQVQQGAVCVDGLPLDRRAVPRAPAPRQRRLALAAAPAPALRPRRHSLVHDHPAARVVLPRAGDLALRVLSTRWSSCSRRCCSEPTCRASRP